MSRVYPAPSPNDMLQQPKKTKQTSKSHDVSVLNHRSEQCFKTSVLRNLDTVSEQRPTPKGHYILSWVFNEHPAIKAVRHELQFYCIWVTPHSLTVALNHSIQHSATKVVPKITLKLQQ